MPLQTRTGSRSAPRELALPPPFTQVRLREMGDAFGHAAANAGKQGAGTLVYVGRFDLAEFALVLEPEEPLRHARRVFYAGMVALVDALAAGAPPETAIGIEWPGALYVNWGLVGGARLAWPKAAHEDEIPSWLVFGAMIRTAHAPGVEPGASPDITALDEEGFGETLSIHVIESFARNFMVAIDAWHESGFDVVAKPYLERLPAGQGIRAAIDQNGDLLVRPLVGTKAERRTLLPMLKRPSWFDSARKAPRG
jgi:biotin-(acetyl-CoA carboxylase) ligase